MVISDGLVEGSDEVGVGGVDVDEGGGEEGRDNILVSTAAGVAQSSVPVLKGGEEVRGVDNVNVTMTNLITDVDITVVPL